MRFTSTNILLFLVFGLFMACNSPDDKPVESVWLGGQTVADTLFSVSGFDGPEAVRYDEELDVYFVSCFNGATSGDANGYISKVSSDGEIMELRYMTGTPEFPFHAGRGMYITGDTLWVADHSGVHYFHKKEGTHLGFVDFSDFTLGFVNDITLGDDGFLYVTDTGQRALYRINNLQAELYADNLPIMPNGITTSAEGWLLFAPWRDGPAIYQLNPQTQEFGTFGIANGGDNFDGIEFFEEGLITSVQQDSSLHLMINQVDQVFISLPGKPADIAINPSAKIVAVPYVALNRVDFWKIKS